MKCPTDAVTCLAGRIVNPTDTWCVHGLDGWLFCNILSNFRVYYPVATNGSGNSDAAKIFPCNVALVVIIWLLSRSVCCMQVHPTGVNRRQPAPRTAPRLGRPTRCAATACPPTTRKSTGTASVSLNHAAVKVVWLMYVFWRGQTVRRPTPVSSSWFWFSAGRSCWSPTRWLKRPVASPRVRSATLRCCA